MFKLGYINVVIGLIMMFVIQILTLYKNLEIKKGTMDGDLTETFFSSSLIAIPLIFLITGVIQMLFFRKKEN